MRVRCSKKERNGTGCWSRARKIAGSLFIVAFTTTSQRATGSNQDVLTPRRSECGTTGQRTAACLSGDGTSGMEYALKTTDNIQAFSECLYNKAAFDSDRVASAVPEHFARFRPFTYFRSPGWLTVESPRISSTSLAKTSSTPSYSRRSQLARARPANTRPTM
jgi:hypothetical protein